MKKTILFLAFLTLLSYTGKAQYAIRIQEGKSCDMLTQSQLKLYLGKLDKLVKLAQQDVDKYGKTGAYPATAINFQLAARNAYDTVQRMINWLNTGSNNLPDNTNYVEASGIMQWMRNVIENLSVAHHWAILSSIYHKSSYASCGKEEAIRLLSEAVNLLYYAGRCYTEPYKEIPVPEIK
jgi:hypothetical protein